MKCFFLLGTFNAFLGVALGAFGAHGLKTKVLPEMLKIWETAVFYQLIHALGLMAIGYVASVFPEAYLVRLSGWLIFGGILLFSGSLYIMVLTDLKPLGMVTPFGGVAFLGGWLILFFSILKT